MNTVGHEKLYLMPIGTLGMYLFLASEAMFFVGLLGAFIVLKSAGGQHDLFVRSSQMLSNAIGLTSVVLLLISCVTLRRIWSIAIISAVLFLGLQAAQWHLLLRQDEGPWQNNFFGCYFLLSAAHALHLVVGISAVLWLRRKLPDGVQIYWHFVNAVGAITFAALYFV